MAEASPTVNRFGPYIVQEKLGGGGMAIVYRAVHEETKNAIALKILRASLTEQPGVVERFKQEAVIANRLKHPHIVAVNNYGMIKGRFFLEMQYLPGGTLAHRFSTPVEMGPQESVRLLRHVASALDYAHRQGVIHRDIKFENILLDSRGNASLADFGIARILDSDRLTATGNVVGTPLYISPEQAQGAKNLDHRVDLYSLGIIAYVLAVGHFPFDGDNILAIMNRHVSEPVPLPTRSNPELPKGVDSVLLKALSKRREDRYASADSFIEAYSRAFMDYGQHSTIIDLGTNHSSKKLVISPITSQSESADELCDKAKAAGDTTEAIRYLKRALELEPLHSKANRMLFQLEGAKSLREQEVKAAAPPMSLDELEPLKKVSNKKKRSPWTVIGIIGSVLMSLTATFFVLTFTGSPIAGKISNMLMGKPQPVNEIQGTPIQNIPNVVLTVQPQESVPLQIDKEVSGVLDNGVSKEYVFSGVSGQEVAIAVWFPAANKVSKNVALLDPQGVSAEALCSRGPLLADDGTNIALSCHLNQAGQWKIRLIGIDGESTGAYFVSVKPMSF